MRLKHYKHMVRSKVSGYRLNEFAVVILWGGSGYDPVPRKALRFISFHQIDSQMHHVAVPFRDRLFKQNLSNHLGL